MDLQRWAFHNGLNDSSIQIFQDEGFTTTDELRHVTDDDVRLTFQMTGKLSLQQCITLREALRDLHQGTTQKPERSATPDSRISEWAHSCGLKTETAKCLRKEGFRRTDDLRHVTQDDVRLTFQKRGKLPLHQCIALREAIKDLQVSDQGHTGDAANPRHCNLESDVPQVPGTRTPAALLEDANEVAEDRRNGSRTGPALRLLVVGNAGSGKTSTVNNIIKNAVNTENAVNTVRVQQMDNQDGRLKHGEWKNRQLHILEPEDWFETDKEPTDVAAKVTADLQQLHPGPDAIVYTVDVSSRYTKASCQVYRQLEAVFGHSLHRHLVVVFTHGDVLVRTGKPIEDLLRTAPVELQRVVRECRNRYTVFNNMDSNTEQVARLVHVIDDLVFQNSHKPFLSSSRDQMEITERLAAIEEKTAEDTLYVKSRKQELRADRKSVKRSRKVLERRILKSGEEKKEREERVCELQTVIEQNGLQVEDLP